MASGESSLLPAQFTGKEDPEAWLQVTRDWLQYKGMVGEKAVAALALLLKGGARQWYEAEDPQRAMTLVQFEDAIIERYGTAEANKWLDRSELFSVVQKPDQSVSDYITEIQKKQESFGVISPRLKEITDVLELKQGEVKLKDVLRSEGKKEVRGVLRGELNELNQQIGAVDAEIEAADDAMKEYTSRKRMREIKDYYFGRMSLYLQMLHVKELAEDSYKEVHCVIKETGSDLPRALLAFYFAVLRTIEKYSTTTLCPIVIDSPKQQDQDQDNWRRILEFIRDNRPPESQLILGLVDDLGIDLGGDVIELTEERQLLDRSEYDDVSRRMRPFIDATLSH